MSTSVFLTQTNASIFPRRSHYTLKDRSISATSHAQPVYSAKPLHSPEAKKVVAGVAVTSTVLATNASITNTTAIPAVATTPSTTATTTASGVKNQKVEPTAGMKIFDTLLYPIFTNVAVFAISVFATYQTKHGDMDTKLGRFFKVRGENLVSWFEGKTKLFDKVSSPFSMNHRSADMAKMVAFSFIDGTLMAPFVVLLENKSVPISKKLDVLMGTEPPDDAPYKEREKRHQGWGSVLTGRLATCAIVVPTAVALDRKVGAFGNKSLNAILFEEPGEKLGEYVQQKYPAVQQKFPTLQIPYLGKTVFFEAFYTSLCTLGLYISSRLLTGPVADFFKGQSTTTTPPKTASTLPPQYA